MTFTGSSDVPRDVTAFCTYIVRTTNTVSLDLIIYTCLLTGAVALLYGLVSVIGKVVSGDNLSDELLKTTMFTYLSSKGGAPGTSGLPGAGASSGASGTGSAENLEK